MENLSSLELSQKELQLLLAIINKAFQQGGLGSGDVVQFAPIIDKLDAKIIKEAEVVEKPGQSKLPNN